MAAGLKLRPRAGLSSARLARAGSPGTGFTGDGARMDLIQARESLALMVLTNA